MTTNYWSNLRGHGDPPSTKGVLQMSWEKGGDTKGEFWVERGQKGYGSIPTGSRFILMGKTMHKEIQMILHSETVLTRIQTGAAKSQDLVINITE